MLRRSTSPSSASLYSLTMNISSLLRHSWSKEQSTFYQLRRIEVGKTTNATLYVALDARVRANSDVLDQQFDRRLFHVLIVLDADDDLPCDKAPEILRRATTARNDRRIGVVLACREYEAWFLAAADSLAGHRDLGSDTTAPANPESTRNAKGWLAGRMAAGRAYQETRDQPAFSSLFDLDQARRGAPSFDKMWRTVEELIR